MVSHILTLLTTPVPGSLESEWLAASMVSSICTMLTMSVLGPPVCEWLL